MAIKWRKVNCKTCIHVSGQPRCFLYLEKRLIKKYTCAKFTLRKSKDREEDKREWKLIPWR